MNNLEPGREGNGMRVRARRAIRRVAEQQAHGEEKGIMRRKAQLAGRRSKD